MKSPNDAASPPARCTAAAAAAFAARRARGVEGGGRRVVAASEEVREVAECGGRGVRADEMGRGVEECLEDARRVASHGGGDVGERGADVEDESAGERGEAVGAEGGEEAGLEGGAGGGAHHLLLVDEALRHLLHDGRRRRHEGLGVGLEELADTLERVLAHALAVVRRLVKQLGHGQAARRHGVALALGAESLRREVDALRAHRRVRRIVGGLFDLPTNLLLGADEVDAAALLVVDALRLLPHRARGVRTDPTPGRATKWRATGTTGMEKIAEGGRRPATVCEETFRSERVHSHTRVFFLGARLDRAKWQSADLFWIGPTDE